MGARLAGPRDMARGWNKWQQIVEERQRAHHLLQLSRGSLMRLLAPPSADMAMQGAFDLWRGTAEERRKRKQKKEAEDVSSGGLAPWKAGMDWLGLRAE